MSRAPIGLSLSNIRSLPLVFMKILHDASNPQTAAVSRDCVCNLPLCISTSTSQCTMLPCFRNDASMNCGTLRRNAKLGCKLVLKHGHPQVTQSSEFLISFKVGECFRRVWQLFLGQLRNFFPMGSWKTSISQRTEINMQYFSFSSLSQTLLLVMREQSTSLLSYSVENISPTWANCSARREHLSRD